MLDHVGQGFLGDTIRCKSHLLRHQVTVSPLPLYELFVQFYFNSKDRFKLVEVSSKSV